MEIRVLRYFLAVAREESISGAAESLHLSQPTLSRQLMDLEKELGKPLFIRGSRRITLTEQGILLIRGDELHVNRLSLEKGEVDVDGRIDSFAYSDKEEPAKKAASFFGRMFQ